MVGPSTHSSGIDASQSNSCCVTSEHSDEHSAGLIRAVVALSAVGSRDFGMHKCFLEKPINWLANIVGPV